MSDSEYYDKYIKYKTQYYELKEAASELEGGASGTVLLVFSSAQSPEVLQQINETEKRIKDSLDKRLANLFVTDRNKYKSQNPDKTDQDFQELVWSKSEPKYTKKEETIIRTKEIPMYINAQDMNNDLNMKGFIVKGNTASQITAQNTQSKFMNEINKTIKILEKNKNIIEKNNTSIKSKLISIVENSIKEPKKIINKLPDLDTDVNKVGDSLRSIIENFNFDEELQNFDNITNTIVSKYDQLITSLDNAVKEGMPQGAFFKAIKVSSSGNKIENASSIIKDINDQTNNIYRLDTAVLINVSKRVHLLDSTGNLSQEGDAQAQEDEAQ